MAEIHRSRTIRPSSRSEASKSYKVDVEGISVDDTLVVTVDHEIKPFRQVFRFSGEQLQERKSIHFKTENDDNIIWSSVVPE